MRLQIISDLHIDVDRDVEPKLAPGADAVIVAGDVQEGSEGGIAFLRKCIPRPTPLFFVLGNHEFYGRSIVEERVVARNAAAEHDVVLLDNDAHVIGGVRFVGATFWTDFCLNGEGAQAIDLAIARNFMNDYRRIDLQKNPWRRFLPTTTVAMHRTSRAFIWQTLDEAFAGPTVVVTHHAPHPKSIHTRFDRSAINPAYVSDQSAMIARFQPQLWVHGHVHNSFDYMLGETRVVANPRGYGRENSAFDPLLTIEIE